MMREALFAEGRQGIGLGNVYLLRGVRAKAMASLSD